MNIIFGKSQAEALKNKFIILELDTLKIGNSAPITSYCVVENIPLDSLSAPETLLSLHDKMLEQYSGRRWTECINSIDALYDKWGTEMNTFYDHIRSRANTNLANEPDDTWSPILQK